MITTGRKFQFWEYHVSHGELLVRSPRDSVNPRNVDIAFVDVRYVEMPRFLSDVELGEVTHDDVTRAGERLGTPVVDRNVFILRSGGRRYVVVAGAISISESDMDIFDSPFDTDR
jgi:hypothetical protein